MDNIKSILGAVALAVAMCGCVSVDASVPNKTDELPELSELPKLTKGVSKDYRPTAGELFYNSGYEALEVFQVFTEKDEDGATVYIALAQDKRDRRNGLIFMVMTPADVVDGMSIAKGTYEYIGIHTYETKAHLSKTVRVFREIADEELKNRIIKSDK